MPTTDGAAAIAVRPGEGSPAEAASAPAESGARGKQPAAVTRVIGATAAGPDARAATSLNGTVRAVPIADAALKRASGRRTPVAAATPAVERTIGGAPPVTAVIGATVRIMGIDPGSQRTGVGVVDVDAAGRTTHVHHQTLGLLDNDSFALRLKQIFDQLGELIERWQPAEIAIENVYVARNNAESALKLGQARGAAICAVVHHGRAVHEYAAAEVKQAVVGRGGAGKDQVQHMVGMLLGLAGPIQADAADALAIALTHAHTRATLGRTGVKRSDWRRGR
jgi:crossover junction endodeoxyribonuclease RuvC